MSTDGRDFPPHLRPVPESGDSTAPALEPREAGTLGLTPPLYHHHSLVLGEDGRKLSKSQRDTGIGELRAAGLTPADIRRMIGL